MILQGLLNIIYKMTYPSDDCRKGKSIIFHGLKFYIIGSILSAIVSFCVNVLIKNAHLNVIHYKDTEVFNDDIEESLFFVIFIIAFFAPLIEECTFRLWMSFKRKAICFSLFFITYIILSLIMPKLEEGVIILGLNLSLAGYGYIKLLLPIVVSLSSLIIKQESLDSIYQKFGHIIINCSVILFACAHISNYTFDWFCLPLVLLLCLPQLVLGITITYYRQKIGFWSGLLFHCLINVISLSLSI